MWGSWSKNLVIDFFEAWVRGDVRFVCSSPSLAKGTMLRALVLLSSSCLGGGGGRALLRASLAFFREPHNAVTLMFLHLSCYAIDISKRLIRNHKTQTKAELFSCTLRSTLERDLRTELKWGSERIVRHLPVPCLRTPALRAASSFGVHFCFGAPIWTTCQETLKSFKLFFFLQRDENTIK